MKPDGTSSFSTADEKLVSQKGNHVTEPDVKTGSEVKKCRQSDGTTWSYLFMHHSKVKSMEAQLIKDGRTYFVHKTIRYFKKQGKHRVQHQEVPTVSGLVFFQGFQKKYKPILTRISHVLIYARTAAQAEWQKSKIHRCNPSCVS